MTRRGFLGLASCLPFLGFAKASEHPKSEIDEFVRLPKSNVPAYPEILTKRSDESSFLFQSRMPSGKTYQLGVSYADDYVEAPGENIMRAVRRSFAASYQKEIERWPKEQ